MAELMAGADRESRLTSRVASRKYVYAIRRAGPELRFDGLGVGAADVFTIDQGRLAAVVSDVDHDRLRPERRNLAAHQQVLRRLMEEGTPLPVSFGAVAASAAAVRKILSRNQAIFLDQLERVDGKAQMGLRVSWDVPGFFEYFVNTHTELSQARDRSFGAGREPTHEQKLELGRLFEGLLEQDRQRHAEQVEAELSHCCAEIKRNPCRTEREVLNLACLVRRQDQDEYEQAVLRAARSFDNNFAFDYSGPWPPYDFVQAELES